MYLRKIFIVFAVVIGISLSTLPAVAQNFRMAATPETTRCRNCGQVISPRVPHKCPQPQKPPHGHGMVTCPKCHQRYPEGQRHTCWVDTFKTIEKIIDSIPDRPPVIVEQPNWEQPSWITCRSCGTRVRSDQWRYHRCPQAQQPPKPQQPQKPQVTVGNALPPVKPSVEKTNPAALKLARFDLNNVNALQQSILDPLKDKQIEEIKKNMPDESAIAIQIGGLVPPLSDPDSLVQAIKQGDAEKVREILKNHDEKDLATFTGLAETYDLINKYDSGADIKQSDIKNLIDTLNNGNPTFLGGLTSSVQTLGKINKISNLLDIAAQILSGGGTLSVTNIPTGVVAIITFPDLPYGVVFPLGNGVYGIGTGGQGNTGIYQGYIPQPPIYGGNSISNAEEASLIIYNHTGEAITYYVHDSEATTLDNDSWNSWSIPSNQIRVKLPSGRRGTWTTSNVDPGTYEFAKAVNGGWTLKEVKTEITIKSPGNPVPFTFFIGDDKYVIEPGKSITLNDPQGGNSIYEIRFARSPDKEDVATYAVGGKQVFYVGKDKSDGKWSLFPEGTEQVKPPTPQQNTTTASSSVTYDDVPISATNLAGLPVLPSYE